MTRTFVKGEPSPEIREWFDLTEEAFEAALDAVEPGATGKDVHDAVCDVYEAAGESTLRADPRRRPASSTAPATASASTCTNCPR